MEWKCFRCFAIPVKVTSTQATGSRSVSSSATCKLGDFAHHSSTATSHLFYTFVKPTSCAFRHDCCGGRRCSNVGGCAVKLRGCWRLFTTGCVAYTRRVWLFGHTQTAGSFPSGPVATILSYTTHTTVNLHDPFKSKRRTNRPSCDPKILARQVRGNLPANYGIARRGFRREIGADYRVGGQDAARPDKCCACKHLRFAVEARPEGIVAINRGRFRDALLAKLETIFRNSLIFPRLDELEGEKIFFARASLASPKAKQLHQRPSRRYNPNLFVLKFWTASKDFSHLSTTPSLLKGTHPCQASRGFAH